MKYKQVQLKWHTATQYTASHRIFFSGTRIILQKWELRQTVDFDTHFTMCLNSGHTSTHITKIVELLFDFTLKREFYMPDMPLENNFKAIWGAPNDRWIIEAHQFKCVPAKALALVKKAFRDQLWAIWSALNEKWIVEAWWLKCVLAEEWALVKIERGR